MTTYTTYQEAKIANQCADIYILDRVGLFTFSDDVSAEIVRFSELCETGIKCNPADHCMTVEKFLANGHKFVGGDLFVGTDGDVISVNAGYHLEQMQAREVSDACRYILRAAALEEKSSEEDEWVNGDECIFAGEVYTFGCVNPVCDQNSVVIFDDTGDYHGCCIDELSKPETKQQREDRERIEAAKHLYSKHCAVVRNPVKDLDNNSELLSAWLTIVDETNYRKEVK